MAHTIAAHFGDPMEDRYALREYVTDEVKRTNGQIRFEDAQDTSVACRQIMVMDSEPQAKNLFPNHAEKQ